MNPVRAASAGAVIRGIGSKMAAEGVTNAGQDAVSQAGQTVNTPGGLKIDPKEVVASGIAGAATGGTIGLPRAVADLNNRTSLFRFR